MTILEKLEEVKNLYPLINLSVNGTIILGSFDLPSPIEKNGKVYKCWELEHSCQNEESVIKELLFIGKQVNDTREYKFKISHYNI